MNTQNLPPLLPREQMLAILHSQVYGHLPPRPEQLSFTREVLGAPTFGGKAECTRVTAHFTLHGKPFSFPFHATVPTAPGRHPFFVHINFRPEVADYYQPIEEILDSGFAVLSFDYNDVTRDDGDFTQGLAGLLFTGGTRGPEDPGKIALWAWAAQRVMDYAKECDVLDLSCAVVCGHSRLGKTALLAAATDTRFAFAYANESGCSGAAISRGKTGETVADICRVFPYWFCENYPNWAGREPEMPFDQHYLVAAIAPRKVLIGSAALDGWACPAAEQLCCFAAASAFETGFPCPPRPAEVGETFFDGHIGYHLRGGDHFFSREDWQKLIRFVNHHR